MHTMLSIYRNRCCLHARTTFIPIQSNLTIPIPLIAIVFWRRKNSLQAFHQNFAQPSAKLRTELEYKCGTGFPKSQPFNKRAWQHFCPFPDSLIRNIVHTAFTQTHKCKHTQAHALAHSIKRAISIQMLPIYPLKSLFNVREKEKRIFISLLSSFFTLIYVCV